VEQCGAVHRGFLSFKFVILVGTSGSAALIPATLSLQVTREWDTSYTLASTAPIYDPGRLHVRPSAAPTPCYLPILLFSLGLFCGICLTDRHVSASRLASTNRKDQASGQHLHIFLPSAIFAIQRMPASVFIHQRHALIFNCKPATKTSLLCSTQPTHYMPNICSGDGRHHPRHTVGYKSWPRDA
jgi:hypothetical protein